VAMNNHIKNQHQSQQQYQHISSRLIPATSMPTDTELYDREQYTFTLSADLFER
jgi:hypothetical protein